MSHTTIAVVDRRRRGFIDAADVWTWIHFAVKHHPHISRRLARAMTKHAAQIREN